MFDEMRRAEQVHTHHAHPVIAVDLGNRGVTAGYPRIVAQNVNLAETLQHRLDTGFHRCLVRYVAGQGQMWPSLCWQRACIQIDEHDVGPFRCEPRRGGTPDPSRCTCDKRNLSLKSHPVLPNRFLQAGTKTATDQLCEITFRTTGRLDATGILQQNGTQTAYWIFLARNLG